MRYVNPHHPAGTLHPQPEGPGMGARTSGARARDAAASMSEGDRDPVFQATQRGERECFGSIVVLRNSE